MIKNDYQKICEYLKIDYDKMMPLSIAIEEIYQSLKKEQGIITKKVVLIDEMIKDDFELGLNHQDDFIVYQEHYLNTIIYYFFGLVANHHNYLKKIKAFMNQNENFIIGIDEENLESLLVSELIFQKSTVSFSESCTGGLLVSRIISIPRASNVIHESYIVYSIDAKVKILGLSADEINAEGLVSPQTASKMAQRVKYISSADYGIATTGYTRGETASDDDGFFYFAICYEKHNQVMLLVGQNKYIGTREEIRIQQTNYCLWQLLKILKSGDS